MILRNFALLIAASWAMVSCAGHGNADKSHPVASRNAKVDPAPEKPSFFAKLSGKLTGKLSGLSLASLLPGSGVKIVQVRKNDLKDLPTGRERALAFESQRKQGFWFFGGPVDFKEPTLPPPGSELDGSLLPPRGP